MLSPEQIQQLKSGQGNVSSATPMDSDSFAKWAQPSQPSSSSSDSYAGGVLGRVIPAIKEAATSIGHSTMDNAHSVINRTADTANDYNNGGVMDKVMAAGRNAIGTAGDVVKEGFDIAGAGAKAAYKIATPQSVQDAISGGAHTVISSPIGQAGLSALGQGAQAYDAWKQDNPKVADALESVVNVAGVLGGGAAENAVTPLVKDAVKTGVDATKDLAGKGLDMAKDAYTGAKDTVGNLAGKASTVGLSKTPEEILATPASKAHTLNPEERAFYKNAQKDVLDKQFNEQGDLTMNEFKAKQAALEEAHNAVETKTATELAANTAKSEQQIADLSKEVDQTAYNKTIELKPKAVQALSNQSKTYQNLIEEDLAPHKEIPITKTEVSDVVNNALPDNPAMAEKIKNELKDVGNVGELYSGLKGVKGDTSKAGMRGNRVYTADDMARDKVVNGLSDLLKEKGVDLSRANNFWRQWAPLRDKIVTKLKPFDTNNLETKTFSEILKSSGDDIHNQNFIKEFENVLGEPITGETQAAMARLSAAEKSKIAAEVDAKMKIEESKLAKKYGMATASGEQEAAKSSITTAKDKAEQALKEEHYRIDSLAKRRTVIKNVLRGAGVLIGNEIIKNATGVGLPFVPTI